MLQRRHTVILIALLLILATQLTACAAINVVAEPGAAPDHVAMVQKTVDAFNAITREDLGITLDRDVQVFVCPDRDSFRDVLRQQMGMSPGQAERSAKVNVGMSSPRNNAVAMHFDLTGSTVERRAYKATAHELFHMLEYQLAGENMGNAFYWLREGAADLVGAVVAAKVGYQSIDRWQSDQLDALRQAGNHASPQEIATTDLDRWTTLLEKERHPYEMADLMVLYLMTRTQTGYRAIADYFRLLGQGIANDAAFERAFGLPPASMLAGFQPWLTEISSRAAAVEITAAPGVPADYLADFSGGAELTRKFFAAAWGRDIRTSLRFILVAGKPAYAAAMVKEFGVSDLEAQQQAKKSTWSYFGSTTIYDTTAYPAKYQRIFSISGLLAGRFANESAPRKSLEQLYWLAAGSSEAVAAHIVDLSGALTKDRLRQSWLADLAKAPAYPSLVELSTAAGWQAAGDKYGARPTSRVILLAGLYLLDKHGPAAFNTWFNAVNATGSAETAFRQAFGMTVDEFYAEFASYLRANIKVASVDKAPSAALPLWALASVRTEYASLRVLGAPCI